MTKVVGGLCGALLLFLLANWAAEGIYHVGAGEGHDGKAAQAYTVAVEGGEAAAPEDTGPFDITTLMADADAAKGEKVFAKCKACHKLDNENSTGPHLNGVIGRDIASVEGFSYSAALQALDGTWTPQHFSEFLTDPGAYAPGTKMAIKLPKPQDRADLIAFLETQK